ncbi:TPA: hypothetical protein ACH3X2_004837 [Trebouxia sp. C0005]
MSRDLSQRIALEALYLQKQAEHQCAQQSLAQLHIHSSCCIDSDPGLAIDTAYDMAKNLDGKTILTLEDGHVKMEYSPVTARFLARHFVSRRQGKAFTHCPEEEWDDVSDMLQEADMRFCIKWHGARYCEFVTSGSIQDAEEYLDILLQVYNTSTFVDKPASRKRKA